MAIKTSFVSASLALFALASGVSAACECGYNVKSQSNAYFRHQFLADFTKSKLSGTATSPSWLESYGFGIADGYQSGAQSEADDQTTPIGSYKNVRVNNGVLQLVVPGGQKITNGGTTSVAELEGPTDVINGVFTMNAKIDPTPGTCQSIFTYHTQDTGTQDEQDIEILTSYLYKAGDNGTPPGIELTNFDPTDPNDERSESVIVPFTADPAAAFHNYTIAWLPTGVTSYYMDSTKLAGPTKYASKNPSVVIINNWSNGDSGFTQGPPSKDSIMQIKLVVGYYNQKGESGLPSGCTQARVCSV